MASIDDNKGTVSAKTLTLHWHEGAAAIYSVCTQPSKIGERSSRLVTGGGDNNVRIWRIEYNEEGDDIKGVEYLSSISKHTQAVNCVRFNSTGDLLATASDDGTIMIWEKNDSIVREFGDDPDDEIKESWVIKVACFASNMSEIYDICWSPDSKYICCGLMDNIIRIFSVSTGSMVKQIAEHSHYVQGVTWDPRGEYICSQSADRSVHVYKVSTDSETGELLVGPTAFYRSIKGDVPSLKLSQLTNENLLKKQKFDEQQQQQQQKQQNSSLESEPEPHVKSQTQEPLAPPQINTIQSNPLKTTTSISNATSSSNTRATTPVSITSSSVLNTPSKAPISFTPSISTILASNSSGIIHSSQAESDILTPPINTSAAINTISKSMEPPQAPKHKRSYSNSSTNSSHSVINRCVSPLPLPAVMPQSPNHIHVGLSSIGSPVLGSVSMNTPSFSSHNNSFNTSFTGSNNNNNNNNNNNSIAYKQHYLYHSETLQSFFRRLTFSPDGSLLITTCGIYKPNKENDKEEIQNTVYVYTRAGLNKGPVVHLPGLRKPSIAVRFSPVKYKLIKGIETDVFAIPYRMLFAIATQDSVVVYDTQRLECVAIATSLHYAIITDIAWSTDGKSIFVSSNDGFISCIVLSDSIVGELDGGFNNLITPTVMVPKPNLPEDKTNKSAGSLKRERDILDV